MAEGIFVISLANSLRFAKVETPVDGSTWDNTLVCQEENPDGQHYGYAQRLLPTDVIKIWFKSAYTTHVAKIYDHLNTEISIPTVVLETGPYSLYTFYSITIDPVAFDYTKAYYILITATDPSLDTVIWKSEPIMTAASWPNHVTIRYTNFDIAFELDYANDTSIEHLLRVPGRLYSFKPEGEIDVYSNQGFLTKIREVVQRVQVLELEPIPRWLAEKINIALAHDQIWVNGEEFVKKSQPQITRFSKTNLLTMTVDLNQTYVVGLNSDDDGMPCPDTGGTDLGLVVVKNFRITGASGTANQDITAYSAKFVLDKIIVTLTSGSATTIKAGWAAGTEDILFETDISSLEANIPVSLSVEQAPPSTGNKVYFTLGSGTFTIDLVLIRYAI